MPTENIEVWRDGKLVETRTYTYELTSEQMNEGTLGQRASDALPELRALASTTGTLTNTQVANGLRLLARVAIAVVRLHLRRLEAVD